MKALAKYQQANNILPATGYLDTTTLTKVNSLSTTTSKCSDTTSPLTTTSRLPKSYIFTTTLKQGMTSPSVKYLQIFLNDNGYIVSLTGPGSKGNESTYFGPATAKALTKYQEYYAKDILTPSGLMKGTGYFGPSTMKKVNIMIQ
jgi:peptidoglycan hydrolase-like protein with peptidoglycan-binding domain